MKKFNLFSKLVILFFSVTAITLLTEKVIISQAMANQWSSFDVSSNTLHVPCFNLGNTSYSLDLGLIASDSIMFELKNFSYKGAPGTLSECASFDFAANSLFVPCFSLADTHYWLEFWLASYDPMLFEMKAYIKTGPYSASGTYDYDPVSNILTMNITASDSEDCGPEIGYDQVSVLSLTSTAMTIMNENSEIFEFIKENDGTGADITGSWKMTTDEEIVELTLNQDASIYFVVHSTDCGDEGFFFVDNKTIAIDGTFNDWTGRDRIYLDRDGADCLDVPGRDIREIYIAQDDTYIYLRYVLNGELDETFGYKFGGDMHLHVRGDLGTISYWCVSENDGGQFPRSSVSVNGNQFEFRVSKDDVRTWWKNKDLNAWCGQGVESVCRDHVDLPHMDLGL